ncbi:Retrotransposon gag domain [Arabidopsis thaliana x Arabidopsis arenosa]|uniref:Retrotransposon gag domain n=1 Tax=Arabidopsis thaliana x Arabidopsis arenosa TaxID=1240361 RepID=A0A8T1YBR0_9BRAS|nr:Retrotransposon gag domain [Arabidopsis thaliana x Arabidopsis arenosa]
MLCDCEIILIVISPTDKPTLFHTRSKSFSKIYERYCMLSLQEREERRAYTIKSEERLDRQDGRDRDQQAPPEANPQGVGDNLNVNLPQPANVINAQHPLNVAARHATYLPPFRRAAPHRTIADYDAPNQYPQDRAAIRVPNPPRRDYEIKPQIIGLVKQNQFHGLNTEYQMDHIDLFEEICSTTQPCGVPEDFLKCKLFPFSSADKAHRWLMSLPPGSINNWEGCKSTFLNHFYTKSRSNSIRNKLQGFQQGPVESFYEAWKRFKDYERDCPHQGFPEGNLLSTFYRGLHSKFQLSLDTASKGDFTTKTVQEGRDEIENLAASNSNASTDFDRITCSSDSDVKQIVELKGMMNQLLRNQNHAVNACETIGNGNAEAFQEFDDTFNQEEEVNYVGTQEFYQNRGYNNNFNNNFRNTSNLSYRNPNVKNTQDQSYPQWKLFQNGFQNANYGANNFQPRAPFKNNNKVPFQARPIQAAPSQGSKLEMMMQELQASHHKTSRDINVKIENVYGELNGNLDCETCFHPTFSLVFGDSSQKTPDGLVRDLQLVVGDCIIPTDFYILEMDKKTERPLILGRLFLATIGAVIDHNRKKTIFANVNKKISYPMISKTSPTQVSPLLDDHTGPDINKAEISNRGVRNRTLKMQSKPPEPPQISKINIIILLELSNESKDQIQEMIRHTKEVLLQAKVFKTSAKGQHVIEAEADYQDIDDAKGKAIPEATFHQA